MPRVAFLGLGAIGAPMARHLARPDFALAVWNRTASKADALARELGVPPTVSIFLFVRAFDGFGGSTLPGTQSAARPPPQAARPG
jgi:3-hydroxyisobutyrate dehydrogenase-like beta-hydroxyacid dehydrogenase